MKNSQWLGGMLAKKENFPQTDATVVLKEDAALDAVKDVTCCADEASSWLHQLC